MKSVWILEKWIAPEEMKAGLQAIQDMTEQVLGECKVPKEQVETILNEQKQRIQNNPNGEWSGWEGKSNYKQFCEVAKDALRRSKKGDKFRVVKAEIEDTAKYWVDYINPQVNEGVMKYLWATK